MNKKFENIVKQKIDESEFVFDAADWNAFEQKLPNQSAPWYKTPLAKGIASVLLIGTITTTYLFNKDASIVETQENVIEVSKESNEKHPKVISPVIEQEEKDSKSSKSDAVVNTNTAEKLSESNDEAPAKEIVTETQQPIVQPLSSNLIEESSEFSDSIVSDFEINEAFSVTVNGHFCKDETIRFHSNTNEECIWKINGKIADGQSEVLTLELSEFGAYEVQLIANEHQWDTVFTLQDLNQPLDFTFEDSKDPYFDYTAKLIANQKLDGDYIWTIGGLEGEIMGSPTNIEFGKAGIFDVELSYTNVEGCEFHINKSVEVKEDFDPLAPTSFTPDGDGTNETFIPHGFDHIEYESFRYRIYDSQGQLVYTSISPTQPWNGRMNNTGEQLFSEYFVWEVVIQNKSREKSFKGKVKILSF